MKIKHIFLPVICVALIITAVGVIPNLIKKDSSNNVPAQKVIGSRSMPFCFMEIGVKTLPEFVAIADKIVIGKVEKVAEVREGRMIDEEGVDAPVYVETFYNVIVEETLLGKPSDNVMICLLGTPDSDLGTTKPKIGENLILFLSENEDGTYAVQGFEKGMFKIMDDKTVVSFSDEQVTAQYDGKSLDFMKTETQQAVREAVILIENAKKEALENNNE